MQAQVVPALGDDLPFARGGLVSNGLGPLEAEGDTLYAGPLLTRFVGERIERIQADALRRSADEILFSLDVAGDTLIAGLGFNDENADNAPSAAGFAVSTDGGQTWERRGNQLDRPTDTTVVFGVSRLPALPIATRAFAPPLALALDGQRGEVWTAGFLSGLRVSDNLARTWKRVVLPPDTASTVNPANLNAFPYVVQLTESTDGLREEGLNYQAYSVHVDERGTVWAGTGAGLNRSTDADVYACGRQGRSHRMPPRIE